MVFLNGCSTLEPLGAAISKQLPHLTIIGWRSKVLDPSYIYYMSACMQPTHLTIIGWRSKVLDEASNAFYLVYMTRL